MDSAALVSADAASLGSAVQPLMWLYWGLFLWPATASISQRRRDSSLAKVGFAAFAVTLTLVIGLRFEVGVDWFNYLVHLDLVRDVSWQESMRRLDPAYGLVNWIAVRTGAGIWLVNLGCAIAFVSGLFAFCRRTPNPWLALTVAMPFMTIVLAINYTRQGAALGFVLWGLVALQDGRVRRFVLCIVAAALFHSTAAVLMPLALFVSTRNRLWVIFWVLISSVLAYVLFLAAIQEAVIQNYLGQGMSSEGGGTRVAMNAVPALLFLLMRRRFDLNPRQRKLWTWLSAITLLFVPALFLSPSSTAVDRLALYFMPIQPFVFSYVPRLARPWRLGAIPLLMVVGTYAAVLFVWFTFSYYRYAWLPYRFYPLEAW